jgi:hypothetical protein
MIEEILDLCLKDISAKRATVADCLNKYPQYANELEPLLTTALALKSVPDVEPSPAFKSKTRAQLLQLSRPIPVQHRMFLSRFSFATAAATILVVLGLTGGLVYAANDSLPDSPLYPIKRGTERVEILFASDALSQSRIYMTFAERRLDEAKALASKTDQNILAEQAIAEYNNQVNASLAATAPLGLSGAAPLTQELTNRITRQQDNLKTLEKKVSASALEKALSSAEKAKEKLNAPASPKPATASPASSSTSPTPVEPTPSKTPTLTPSTTTRPFTPQPSVPATATQISIFPLTVSATIAPTSSTGTPIPNILPIQPPPSILPTRFPTVP